MSQNPEIPHSLYPVAFGNEEETGMLIDHGEGFDEPYGLVQGIEYYVPENLRGHKSFLTNGAKIYAGGTGDETEGLTNLERATAECSTLDQLVARIRANEKLLIDVSSTYAKKYADTHDTPVHVRIQRRVVDGHGSRKGCHDNFSVNGKDINDPSERTSFRLHPMVLGHIVTRSFVSGAGHFTDNGTHYGQKIGGLVQTEGRRYGGTVYRITSGGANERLEVRSNDINISDWAIRSRVGSTALALAVAGTELADGFSAHASHNQYFAMANYFNELNLHRDGSIEASGAQHEALDFQMRLAEVALFELEHIAGPLPDDLRTAAEELYFFCRDYKQVLDQDASVRLLADRADWAAKAAYVLDRIDADQNNGVLRSTHDIQAQADDLRYDHIALRAVPGLKSPRVTHGYGYKHRDAGNLKHSASEKDVARAYWQAPETTRAHERARILKEDKVTHCDWHTVNHIQSDGTYRYTTLPNAAGTPVDMQKVVEFSSKI